MAIQTTDNLTNSIRARYLTKYLQAAQLVRVYDQLAAAVGKDDVEAAARMAKQVNVNFLSDMEPGVTALSQTSDITPQILRDAQTNITPTSRGEALQWAEALDIQVYTDYGAQRHAVLGKNQMESVDLLALDVACAGDLRYAAAARASLDAGTPGHNLSDTTFTYIHTILNTLKVPSFIGNGRNQWFAIMDPAVWHDLRLGGNIIDVAKYQDKEIVMSFELGQIGPFKLIVTPFAKKFIGQGAANALAVNTTLNGAVKALDKEIVVASGTNISSGMWLNIIEGAETGNTFYPKNERVRYISGTTTVKIVGEGANGGLRFDHASGVSVTNADTVYPVIFGGPMSLAKLYDSQTGEYGKVIGPKVDGLLEQFAHIGWKYYGGYGRWVESWIMRGEYSASLEA